MASITLRNGRYLVRVRKNGFSTETKTFHRKSDGIAWGKHVEVEMEAGRWGSHLRVVPPLREVIQDYRKTVVPAMKGAATYRYRLDEFEALPFAALPIDRVTAADVSLWRDRQSLTLKPATVVRKLAMLSAIFSWAHKERNWVSANPVSGVRKPRVADGRRRVLTPEEQVYLMRAAASSKAAWLAPALTILMRSAMRRGELFALKRQDVDYGVGLAQLSDSKNGSARQVPLCPLSLAALRLLDMAAERAGTASLLPVGSGGSVSTRFSMTVQRARGLYVAERSQMQEELDPGFLQDLRLHDLRHHAVTTWASTGSLSLLELMDISGHKTPRMLTRYTHMKIANLARKLAGLSESMSGAGPTPPPGMAAPDPVDSGGPQLGV